jgi:hypothetical protein
MRGSRLGDMLLGAGVVVGVAAVVGMIVGFEPARLPPALLNIAAYKLTIGAAVGLLAAGAAVRRYAKREVDGTVSRVASVEPNAALPPPPAHIDSPKREAAKSEVRRP